MRIAILGAGSLGIVIGGLLAEAGRDVVLVVASERSAQALNGRGAVITGALERTVPVHAVTSADLRGAYDLVFLLTKRTATAEALAAFLPHLAPQGVLCTLQNGVPEEEVAAIVGRERTVGGVVVFAATRPEPGVSRITTSPELLRECAMEIGEVDGRITPRIRMIGDVLSAVGGCRVVENLMDIRWAKLLVNAGMGSLTAAFGCDSAEVLARPEALDLAVYAADEIVRTAHACGFRPAPLQGRDLDSLELRPGDDPEAKREFLRAFFRPHGRTKSSMLQDLENGRKTEIDYINGYVCRKAREHGLATPCNDLVVRLVRAAQDTGRPPETAASLAAARELLATLVP